LAAVEVALAAVPASVSVAAVEVVVVEAVAALVSDLARSNTPDRRKAKRR